VVFVREKERFIKEEKFVGSKSLRLAATRVLSFGIVGKPRRRVYHSDDRYTVNGIEFRAGLVTVIFCGKVYHGIRIETDPTIDQQGFLLLAQGAVRGMDRSNGCGRNDGLGESKDLDTYFSVYPAPKPCWTG